MAETAAEVLLLESCGNTTTYNRQHGNHAFESAGSCAPDQRSQAPEVVLQITGHRNAMQANGVQS